MKTVLLIIIPLAVICFLVAFCINAGRMNKKYDEIFEEDEP